MLIGGVSNKDSEVVFDEEQHKYYVNEIQMKTSVTQLVHMYFSHFNAEKIAKDMLLRKDFRTNPKYESYQTILQDIAFDKSSEELNRAKDILIESWDKNRDQAAEAGTAMHKSIEDFYRDKIPLPDTKESKLFMNFHDKVTSMGYNPYRSEQIVWSEKYNIAGSVDMMYIHDSQVFSKTPNIWLCDWKRSKKIEKCGYGKKGKGPLNSKEDCNYEHYSLQLNIYKYLLERSYDMKITRMSIVVLHPNQDLFELYDVVSNQITVRKILNEQI